MESMTELEDKTRDELEVMAKEGGITGYSSLKKAELIRHILQSQAVQQGNLFVNGVLEIMNEDYK